MHQYSLDKNIREKVLLIIVILSMAISYMLKYIFAEPIETIIYYINQSEALSLFVKTILDSEIVPSIISASVIYKVLLYLFDRFLWKFKPLNLILGIPDLNGKWTGTLQSSFDDKSYDMILEIKQTWTKIQCKSSFDKSSSNSKIASIYLNDPESPVLYFSFHNQSQDLETRSQQYDGFNILSLSTDKKSLSGKYFNDRPNPKKTIKGGNMGKIELFKKVIA